MREPWGPRQTRRHRIGIKDRRKCVCIGCEDIGRTGNEPSTEKMAQCGWDTVWWCHKVFSHSTGSNPASFPSYLENYRHALQVLGMCSFIWNLGNASEVCGGCIFRFMCTCIGVHKEAKSQPGYCFLEAVQLIQTASLTKTWDLTIGLGWLASEPQRAASLCLPNTEITSVPSFWQEFLGSISGSDACIASTLPSELSVSSAPAFW